MRRQYVGIDIGSTTLKISVLDESRALIYSHYERHQSRVREKTLEMVQRAEPFLRAPMHVAISGSAGMGVAQDASIPFVQEVMATERACMQWITAPDAAIELGGEDAKILFFTGGHEVRMNGSCAGGTGAFIDQMATLLAIPIESLDDYYRQHKQIYGIASRCGVFAKSDIQPLLNQGASKADIAASIYASIVNQTVAGLAQGREICGRVVFLGGPLTFLRGLGQEFVKTLGLSQANAIFPPNSELFVAMGAALESENEEATNYNSLVERLRTAPARTGSQTIAPLFQDEAAYRAFTERHQKAAPASRPLEDYHGDAYLGIDAGSTTTKLALMAQTGELLYTYYASNHGEPISLIKAALQDIYRQGAHMRIRGAAVTGYGEALVKAALRLDAGLVETVAHYLAARQFDPDVDFLLDIGGQDIKCFRIRNGVVDSIMLNEACSSGCGSFIESFAKALGYDASEFASLGLFSRSPVNLGTRCTIFMNSSVKQAQKDGARVEDISAGLAVSVVKNALYKVIRAREGERLGGHVVVQGGTMRSDAILRALEQELGQQVTRPAIAGLMGAYGAALYARSLGLKESTIRDARALDALAHTSNVRTCKICANACTLTVNRFDGEGGKPFISNNRCERPLGKTVERAAPNAYADKLARLLAFTPKEGKRGCIGLPLGLNMYMYLPFWHTLLSELDFRVEVSGVASHELYRKGQFTIPSDTVCYPAKLMHGHVAKLLEQGVDTIFYPCMPYDSEEMMADNHYHCPVVAYYPELLRANMPQLREARFLAPYFAPHARSFTRQAVDFFARELHVPARETRRAVKKASMALQAWREANYRFGDEAIAQAGDKPVMVLAGRPYHIDPEINHGIDQLLLGLGCVVISEDCLRPRKAAALGVLNQWTNHARMYAAAERVAESDNMHLVQLVSFGCGLDAVTTDEIQEILHASNKHYTQIKIDEINNLGAATIRLRSLLTAMEMDK